MPDPPWIQRKEAVIIVNPTARKLPSPGRIREVRDWLDERGWAIEWLETAAPGDATSLAANAARRGVPLLFVCGGDGTLNEAVNGLAGSETALAVIPTGTVNLWAREVGLLKKPAEAVRLAVDGARRRIDLGQAGERYFLLMAGFGLDAAVTHGVSHRIKGRFGAAAYALSAAREALRYRSSRVTLSLDGRERTLELLMLIVGNTRKYAGLTEITPAAIVDDGWLDVCAYSGRGRLGHPLARPSYADAAATAVEEGLAAARSATAASPQPRRCPSRSTAMPLPTRPWRSAIAPGALWVAVPAGLKSPLFSREPPSR